jgi:serine/threonine protein kinase
VGILLKLSSLAAQPLIGVACQALKLEAGQGAIQAVSGFLIERFTNHSEKLSKALQRASERSWQALEFALAGKTLLERFARAEDKAFRQQVEGILTAVGLEQPANKGADFRQCCLEELRAARTAGVLSGENLELSSCARAVADLTRYASPSAALDAEWQTLGQIAEALAGHYPNLGLLVRFRTHNGFSILTAASRYFFRREIITDAELCQEHFYSQIATIREKQEEHFQTMERLFIDHHEKLNEAIAGVVDEVRQLRQDVTILKDGIARLLDAHNLNRRTLSSRDSFAYRDEAEREQILYLAKLYRALPAEQRRQAPELLRGLGKLQVVGGDYDAAEQHFRELASLTTDPAVKAEAHFNAYQTALEKHDWEKALQQLREACTLDPGRFSPFPLQRYTPQRILGAGGFGVAFLCHDENLKRPAVVKALQPDNLGGDPESVLKEARALLEVQHRAIVTLYDCDHADQVSRTRPYIVMEYFESESLEDYVRKNGKLSPADCILVAREVAEALLTAHEKGILHRDVKPGNILVRRNESGWLVKLIDFGLALKHDSEGLANPGNKTVLGAAIAGTVEYASPEQMGRLRDVRPGPRADVYSFAKTVCYALFQTTQPQRKHWAEIPPNLVDLLENSLSEKPEERPESFRAVLEELKEHPSRVIDDSECDRILEQFQKRLNASISRSPMLKVSITKLGRLLDVGELSAINSGKPAELLTAIIGGKDKVTLDLRPGRILSTATAQGAEADPTDRLYKLLNQRMRRDAETARRETGVHALWLGYPLLYASKGSSDSDRWILAPIFLWPITIDPLARPEKHLRIARAGDPESARFNRVMAMWIRRELGFSLSAPDDEDLSDADPSVWQERLKGLLTSFAEEKLFDFSLPLQRIPQRKSLQGSTEASALPEAIMPQGPGIRLLHSAVLGYFRWQNEAIGADLEEIKATKNFRGVVRGFVSTARLPEPAEVNPPPEEERFLVSDTDFSQERVVWQARSGPGWVVHGPPGTGKSQTIVNVIADTLARGRTVLMVCQKQAATRVVLERLRAAGLADLCLEVHDAEQDRKAVFRAIKEQVESLAELPSRNAERDRQHIAQEITTLEKELDLHAQAFHQKHRQYEISYRDMKTLQQEQQLAFPTVRALPSLQRILEGLPWPRVEAIARKAREIGILFAEADPFHNPWRFGQLATIQQPGVLRMNVCRELERLRLLDAQQSEHIRLHGAALPLPQDLATFLEVGSDVLTRLRPLASAPQSLDLRWLAVIRKLPAHQRQALGERAQQVVTLAQRVKAAASDPYWQGIAATEPNFAAVAEDLVGRLEAISNDTNPGKGALTKSWVETLLDKPEEVPPSRRRCRDAGPLVAQLLASPVNPQWQEIERRHPDFPNAVLPVIETLERLAADQNQTLTSITQVWLKAVRGAEPAKLQQFESDCRKAVRLVQMIQARGAEAAAKAPTPETADFTATASELLDRLSGLRGESHSPNAVLTRHWLRGLQHADETDIRKRFSEVRKAVEQARQITAAPPDGEWDKVCGGWSASQLEVLRGQASAYMRQNGRLFAFLSGAYRQAKRHLLRLRPDATPDSLPFVAASLVDYLDIRDGKRRLADRNAQLIPDYSPSAEQTLSFPKVAEETLEAAAWLLRQALQQPAFAKVLEEFIRKDGQAGPAEAALREQVDRLTVWQQLEKLNHRLVPELRPRLDATGNRNYPGLALKGFEQATSLMR